MPLALITLTSTLFMEAFGAPPSSLDIIQDVYLHSLCAEFLGHMGVVCVYVMEELYYNLSLMLLQSKILFSFKPSIFTS